MEALVQARVSQTLPYARRAEAVDAIATGKVEDWVNQLRFFVGSIPETRFLTLAVNRHPGANDIADMPGWVPDAEVYPDLWAENATPGTTDMTAAFAAAEAYCNNNVIGLHLREGARYVCNRTLHFRQSGQFFVGRRSTLIRTDGTFGDTLLVARTDPATQLYNGFKLEGIQFQCLTGMTNGAVLHFMNVTRVHATDFFIQNHCKAIWTEGIQDSNIFGFQIVSLNSMYLGSTVAGSCHFHVDDPANPAIKSTETYFSDYNCTTMDVGDDIDHSYIIDGFLDGVFFADGHTFGGAVSTLLIDGDNTSFMMLTHFSNVFFDGRTPRNFIIRGATSSGRFHHIEFDDCKFYGSQVQIGRIDKGCNAKFVQFNSCKFGSYSQTGMSFSAGTVTITGGGNNWQNIDGSLGDHVVIVPADADASTELSISGFAFDMYNLTYGVRCLSVDATYHINNNTFRNVNLTTAYEIYYDHPTLKGTCEGNVIGREIAQASAVNWATVNIAAKMYRMTGATADVINMYPVWDGREIFIRASTADQNIKTDAGGNIRNYASAETVQIAQGSGRRYLYNATLEKWMQA